MTAGQLEMALRRLKERARTEDGVDLVLTARIAGRIDAFGDDDDDDDAGFVYCDGSTNPAKCLWNHCKAKHNGNLTKMAGCIKGK